MESPALTLVKSPTSIITLIFLKRLEKKDDFYKKVCYDIVDDGKILIRKRDLYE